MAKKKNKEEKKVSVPRERKSAKPKAKLIKVDFSTAEEIPEGDPRKISEDSPVIAFLVDNEEGDQVVFHCMKGNIPAEAKKKLGI